MRNDRVRLSTWNLRMLEAYSRRYDGSVSSLRIHLTRSTNLTIDKFWDLLKGVNGYSNTVNLSSRKFPEEELLGHVLITLSPHFNAELLRRYEEKGYFLRSDVIESNNIYHELEKQE